jgi:formylmethanofuran dehydrogenase subunit E
MIKRLFDYLFYSCRHKWEIHHSGELVDEQNLTTGIFYHLRCSKCGEMKFEKSNKI